jgi:GAF domain-containing protein
MKLPSWLYGSNVVGWAFCLPYTFSRRLAYSTHHSQIYSQRNFAELSKLIMQNFPKFYQIEPTQDPECSYPANQAATNRRRTNPPLIKLLSSSPHVGEHASVRGDALQFQRIYPPQQVKHQGRTRHLWKLLSFRAKTVVASACLMLPLLANRTDAYYLTNQSITSQTTQAKFVRTNEPANITFVPQRQPPLTLLIETGVAALLLVGLLSAYLANRAIRPILTAAATSKKLDKGELESADIAFSRLETQLLQKAPSLTKNQEAAPEQALSEQQKADSELAQIMTDFNLRIRQSLYREDILKTAVKEVRRILKTDRVAIYALDPTSWDGIFIAESVAPGWPQLLGVRMHDPCFTGRHVEMYKNGRVHAIDNIHQEPGLSDCHIRTLEQFAVKANLVAPILRYGELLALMIAHHCSVPRSWHPLDVDVFAQLATQVGLAADEAELLEKQEAAVEQAQLVAEITRRLHEALYLEDLLKTTVKEVRRALKTDRVVIYGLDTIKWDGIIIAESVAPGWPQMLKVRIYDPCLKERHVEMYKNGRVRAINDIHQEPGFSDCHIRLLEQFAVKANLVVPIRKNGQLLALMIAHHCCEPRVWDQPDIDLFAQVATQVGIAIDQLSFLQKLEQEQAR